MSNANSRFRHHIDSHNADTTLDTETTNKSRSTLLFMRHGGEIPPNPTAELQRSQKIPNKLDRSYSKQDSELHANDEGRQLLEDYDWVCQLAMGLLEAFEVDDNNPKWVGLGAAKRRGLNESVGPTPADLTWVADGLARLFRAEGQFSRKDFLSWAVEYAAFWAIMRVRTSECSSYSSLRLLISVILEVVRRATLT